MILLEIDLKKYYVEILSSRVRVRVHDNQIFGVRVRGYDKSGVRVHVHRSVLYIGVGMVHLMLIYFRDHE